MINIIIIIIITHNILKHNAIDFDDRMAQSLQLSNAPALVILD